MIYHMLFGKYLLSAKKLSECKKYHKQAVVMFEKKEIHQQLPKTHSILVYMHYAQRRLPEAEYSRAVQGMKQLPDKYYGSKLHSRGRINIWENFSN